MTGEIILVCNSINNKNVREGELKILRKFENELYFEFGESEMNLKKRFYKDVETLNTDYKKLEELKNKEAKNIEEKETKENLEEENKIKKTNYSKKSMF